MTTQTLTLSDFLLARIAEDEEREVDESRAEFVEGLAGESVTAASVAHDRLLRIQVFRLNRALARAGWAIATSPPFCWLGFGWLARLRASPYADHPDFNPEWRI